MASLKLPPLDLVYPESDGMPMADNTDQYRYMTVIAGGLEAMYRKRSDVFVAGDLLWYPVEGHPEVRVAPDVLVAFGRPPGMRGSYRQWLEDDVPIHIVFEILSKSNRSAEMALKFDFYQTYGVEEYYTYHPKTGGLHGYYRQGDELRPRPAMNGFTSPLLGVRFELIGKHLHLLKPDGTPFKTFAELDAEQERDQLRIAELGLEKQHLQQQMDAERLAKEQAKTDAERLKAKLRAAGIDPDA